MTMENLEYQRIINCDPRPGKGMEMNKILHIHGKAMDISILNICIYFFSFSKILQDITSNFKIFFFFFFFFLLFFMFPVITDSWKKNHGNSLVKRCGNPSKHYLKGQELS